MDAVERLLVVGAVIEDADDTVWVVRLEAGVAAGITVGAAATMLPFLPRFRGVAIDAGTDAGSGIATFAVARVGTMVAVSAAFRPRIVAVVCSLDRPRGDDRSGSGTDTVDVRLPRLDVLADSAGMGTSPPAPLPRGEGRIDAVAVFAAFRACALVGLAFTVPPVTVADSAGFSDFADRRWRLTGVCTSGTGVGVAAACTGATLAAMPRRGRGARVGDEASVADSAALWASVDLAVDLAVATVAVFAGLATFDERRAA